MLNKIKIIGKILLNKNEEKESGKRENNKVSSTSQESADIEKIKTKITELEESLTNLNLELSSKKAENKTTDQGLQTVKFEMEKKLIELRKRLEREENPRFYFSLSVVNPSLSSTILRCVVQGENAERMKKEIKGDDLLEIRGYLRNERDGRQILIKVLQFNKLDTGFKVDKGGSNQVRLIGKIITDFQEQETNKYDPGLLSFKLAVPREGNKSPLFFCRVHSQELVAEVREKLKKNDIILLEGFLQTKKIEEGLEGEVEKKISRISSIICSGFTFLDSDLVSTFSPLDNLTRIAKGVREIDFK